MNHAKPAAIAALVCLFACMSATLSWAQSGSLGAAGETRLDGKTWVSFNAPSGLRVLAASPLPEYALPRLERVAAAVAAWSSISATELRADYSGQADGDDYVVLVSSVRSGQSDYAKNVNSGIRLRFTGALVYDFRVKADDYFVRVRGVLMDDASLAGEIAKAADDPADYIAERDPAWAAGRIMELEASITKSQETMQSLEEAASESMENLRKALAAQMNKGLFGPPKPVAAEVIALVQELKKTSAAATRADAAALAKERGIKASAKELEAIFRVWYSE
ncbi:MAG: hypothetical protein A2Y38_06685 [Spirochaetes bacterium GWB1_59_5]|nr:MAG: hypothetical protein A2Y38_06685 [Spirochaetes bacterium GWB1_59_5]